MDQNPADLLLINGTIDTLTAQPPRVSAPAIRDGRVAGLGDDATELGPDEWVVGGSWGSGLLGRLSSVDARARLDAAAGGRPALLKDDSKHNRWADSRALELAGMDGATADPAGGEILHDAAGQATGVLLEAGGGQVEKSPDFIKIFLDGVPPSGTGTFLEPHLPDAGFPSATAPATSPCAWSSTAWRRSERPGTRSRSNRSPTASSSNPTTSPGSPEARTGR